MIYIYIYIRPSSISATEAVFLLPLGDGSPKNYIILYILYYNIIYIYIPGRAPSRRRRPSSC